MGKKVLIVFAHWSSVDSLNKSLLDTAVNTLESQGHEVTVTNLLKMNFKPSMSEDDFSDSRVNPDKFDYPKELAGAWKRGTVKEDIAEEIEKWNAADLVILQFPLCWGGMPGSLKGYIDRVFVQDAIYNFRMMFDNGKFKGKRALVSVTGGAPEKSYSDSGLAGNIDVILWPVLNNILRYVGFDLLGVNACLGVGFAPNEKVEGWLTDWSERLVNIFDEEPIQLPKRTTFGLVQSSDTKEDKQSYVSKFLHKSR